MEKAERIMRLRIPDYYKSFRCTADKCRKNCCAGGWDIEVDADTLELYKKDTESKKLMSCVRKKDGYTYFKTKKTGCVWLDEKGLCGLYKEKGEDYQSLVCRQFPRFSEYFGDIKETGIGLGCEESAKLIFSGKKRPELVLEEIHEEPYEDGGYDGELAEAVFEVRRIIFEMLYRNDIKLGTRLVMVMKMCDRFQDLINDGDVSFASAVEQLRKLKDTEKASDTKKISPALFKEGLEAVMCVFEELPDMRRDLEKMLFRTRKFLDRLSGDKLKVVLEEFDDYLEKEGRSHEYEAFLWYLTFRYFGKTVYDGDASLKGRLLTVFYLFMRLADTALWQENRKKFTFAHRIENAETFSREVEYSEDNMEQIYEMFLFEEDLDVTVLGRLL